MIWSKRDEEMAVNDMTLEERVAFLEQELARMDSKPENPLNVYGILAVM